MQPLPEDIKIQFFAVLSGSESIGNFEQWLYDSSQLEAVLKPDDYLDLLSLDYTSALARENLVRILKRLVNVGEYETWRLANYLIAFLNRTEDVSVLLCEFYNLYCHRVGFLEVLGLEYGLPVVCLDLDLPSVEREQFIHSLLPGAVPEAKKVLHYLENGTVGVSDRKFEIGDCYVCWDNRPKEEIPARKVRRIQSASTNVNQGFLHGLCSRVQRLIRRLS